MEKSDYHEGKVRTQNDCPCGAQFMAIIDYDIDGDHRVVCPRCGRQHYRRITKGVVTQTRWSKYPEGEDKYIEAPADKYWRNQDGSIQTVTPTNFIKERFLRRNE